MNKHTILINGLSFAVRVHGDKREIEADSKWIGATEFVEHLLNNRRYDVVNELCGFGADRYMKRGLK